MESKPRIAVVGGGVNGIGAALAILRKIPKVQLTVYSEKYSPDTTGDGAGGLWTPFLIEGTSPEKIVKWSKATWDLIHSWWRAGEPGVLITPMSIIDCQEIPEPAYIHIPFGYSILGQKELQEFGTSYTNGYKYSAFVAEPKVFLPKLIDSIKELGGTFKTKRIENLDELSEEADVIINCTGIGSYDLVPDHKVFPIRGQVLRVNAPWVKMCIINQSEDTYCYVIPNTKSVVLGGTHQENDWRTTVDEQDSQTIKENCLKVMPSLKVVHNYGHGGSGVSLFWGCALEVSDHVAKILSRYNAPVISRL